jgi:hypothetical protein
VLLVSFGEDGVLLGADLERSQDATRGWMPAVRRARELGITASLVKIPHHGSPTAHDEQMWSDALKPNPGAALTPFFSGTSPLPQPDDRTRIRGLTSRGYLTTDKAQSTDTALLSAALPGGLVRAIEGNVGHVRWRRKLDGSDDWRVTLDENACGV